MQLELQSLSSGIVITRKIPLKKIRHIWVDGHLLLTTEFLEKYPAYKNNRTYLPKHIHPEIELTRASERSRSPGAAVSLLPVATGIVCAGTRRLLCKQQPDTVSKTESVARSTPY